MKCNNNISEVPENHKKRQVQLHEIPSEVTSRVLSVQVLSNTMASAEHYNQLKITIILEEFLC